VSGEFIAIGEVSRRLGIHPQTVRRMEKRGILLPAMTINGVRIYDASEVERLVAHPPEVKRFGRAP